MSKPANKRRRKPANPRKPMPPPNRRHGDKVGRSLDRIWRELRRLGLYE